MEIDKCARLTASSGAIAGLLWLVNWAYLHAAPDAAVGTASWYAGQTIAAVAILGTAALSAGLWWVEAGGPGRFARIALGTWTLGWLLVLAAAVVTVLSRNDGNPLFPIGGLLTSVAGIASGIVIVRAKVLNGWRRFTPLALALWYGLVLGGIMAVAQDGWAASAAELVQYLLILLTAAATGTARLAGRVTDTRPVRN